MTDDSVTFKWKDRKNNNATKTLKLDASLFIKRFLYHVLPSGFMKIRHYGFIGNAHRKKNILLARKLLNVPNNESTNQKDIPCDFKNLMILLTGKDPTICPKCNKGHLFVKYEIDSYFSKQHKYIKAGD